MLNYDLMKQPLNWVTIWLMLLIASFAGHYFISWFKSNYESEEE